MSEKKKQDEDAAELEAQPSQGDALPPPTAGTEDPAAEWREKYLRSLADLDNYRKRMERERQQHRLYACEDLVKAILPVLDDLQMACEAEGGADAIRQGVALALRKALGVLEEGGLKPIEAVGKPFDPRLHEAMGSLPSADAPPGTVVAELRRGYQLHDRVIRPSRVQIAVAPNGDSGGGGANQSEDE